LGLGHSPSLLAASLTALDPALAAQSRSIMTETLAAFLLSATLVTFSGRAPWSPLLGGLWLGASVLCRPSLLPSALMTAAAALAFGPGSGKVRMLRSGSILLGVVLPLLPWAVRNASILGTPVWTTTHGGFTLYLANNPVYYEDVVSSRGAAVWSGERQRAWFVQINEEASGLAEPVADRLFTMRALETIRAHPWVFLHASLKRLARFWGIAPSEAVYSTPQRLLAALWTIPFWILVCGGAMRRSLWKWPACACPAIVAGLTCVHLFYWTDLRMRAPLVPALALIAAGSWTALSEWQSRREAVIG
jgi:hypothetical protein